MKVYEVEIHGKSTPNDEELLELMMQKPDYRALRKAEEEEKFQSIQARVKKALGEDARLIDSLKSTNPLKMSTAAKNQWFDTHLSCLKGFIVLQKGLCYEISQLCDELVGKDRKAKLLSFAQKIGHGYELKLRQFAQFM